MTRLPPYLKRHADRLRNDPSVSVWIAIGVGAWSWVRERQRTHIATLCPPSDDPATFDWSLCAGHDPVLLQLAGATEGEQVRALIEALMRGGVNRVLASTGLRYCAEVEHA